MNELRVLLAAALVIGPVFAADPFRDESLHYSVNWPSGLSLGEARMEASRAGDRWKYTFTLDAAIPGFAAQDTYESLASGDFCSAEFTRRSMHGKRKSAEKTVFNSPAGTALRQTLNGGGSSRLDVPACPHDALTFLFFIRRELAGGRVPGPQTVYFGAPYQVRLEFGGVQTVRVNDAATRAERVLATYKGPASGSTFEMYFAPDAVRTPVLVRATLPAGTFTLELNP